MRACFALPFVLIACSVDAEPSAGCASNTTLDTGEHELLYDNLARRYLLDLPTVSHKETPLLVALHGYTGSPESIGVPGTDEFVRTILDKGWMLVRPASTVFEATLNDKTAKAIGVITREADWPHVPDTDRTASIASWNDLAGKRIADCVDEHGGHE